jgi:hypothetical protein
MQYFSDKQQESGDTDGATANVSITGSSPEALRETAAIHLNDLLGGHRDKGECFCEEFCSRFCPAFCQDFCSDVRDDVCGKKHENSERPCCHRDGCREVACRACKRVFCEMGIQCPGNFCRCFADLFCRAFCREFECVRRRLCECHHGRKAICCEGCREICCRVCPCVCRKLRCLLAFD